MRPTRRALLAPLALVGALVVAPSPTGAQEAELQWSFSPAAPVADPDPAPTDLIRADVGPNAECASMDVDFSLSLNGQPLFPEGLVRDDGSMEVAWQAYTPGRYLVQATCHHGSGSTLVSGTVDVAPGTDPRQPTLTASPLAVGLRGTVEVTGTHCTVAEPGRTLNVIAEGPGGRAEISQATDASGSATVAFVPELYGTYTLTATCSVADLYNIFVYPEALTVVVAAPPGSGDGTTTTTTTTPADDLGRPPAARGVAASPRFTG